MTMELFENFVMGTSYVVVIMSTVLTLFTVGQLILERIYKGYLEDKEFRKFVILYKNRNENKHDKC